MITLMITIDLDCLIAVSYTHLDVYKRQDQEYAAIPCCHASSIYALNLYVYQYLVGNSEQSVSAENRLKRISHVERVTKDLLIYWKDCKDLTDSGKEYLLRKIEGVILSHYVVTCIIQKDKRNGRKNAERYNQMIRETVPAVFAVSYTHLRMGQVLGFL